MTQDVEDLTAVRQRRVRRAQLGTLLLGLLTLLLFSGLGYSSYYHTYSLQEFPPTATIPPNLGDNLVFVSSLSGIGQSTSPDEDTVSQLRVGSTLVAEGGTRVELLNRGELRLSYANGAVLFLDDNTAVALDEANNRDAAILLHNGRLLIVETDGEFSTTIESGAQLNVNGSSVAGATYAPEEQLFVIDCLVGTCEAISAAGDVTIMIEGDRISFSASSPPVRDVARYEQYRNLGEPGIVPTATPTRRAATSTPPPATATATPLPPTATATPLPPTPTLVPTAKPTEPAATEPPTPTPSATESVAPTATVAESDTPTPAATAQPTDLPEPTATPAVEATATPTAAAQPSATPSPATPATATPTPAPATSTPAGDPTETPVATALPATPTITPLPSPTP